jgi:oligosaccharide reducing-end xylanase
MVNEANTMIVFVPGSGGNEYSDASYHLPAFYELWARWGPVADREFWAQAANRSRLYFTQVTNPVTGLAPDYANFDGTPHPTAFNPMAANSSFDSWRVVSNWSVDEAWWGSNDAARGLSDRLQHFLAGLGVHTFPGQYTLAGKPLSSIHASGIVATVAVGSLVATRGAMADAFVDELWNAPIPRGAQRYYDGMLYMMSLLHVSGEFRIWQPRSAAAVAKGRQ